mmetsp:Transcript_19202/g.50921  ORF Transcript_19202/g.50921 Transcript_19202/m.50921 type:complete len:208 (-) Transcript_19202:846-1469(-)
MVQEGDRRARLARAPRAADAVHVVLRVVRGVEVDDQADSLHVKAAPCHVGGDEDFALAGLEGPESPVAALLVAVPMDGLDPRTGTADRVRKLLTHSLGGDEDNDLIWASAHQANETVFFLPGIPADLHLLVDGGVRLQGVGVAHPNLYRVTHEVRGQVPDLLWPSCGEHVSLALPRTTGKDLADLRLKAHVQHPVRLVHAHVAAPVQ